MINRETKNKILRLRKMGYAKASIAEQLKINRRTVDKYLDSSKTVLVVSDMHCGHAAGLTPPKWRPYTPAWKGFYEQWDMVWQSYVKICEELKPAIVLDLGDSIDGKGQKSGGSELITTTWKKQAEMAADCLMQTNAKKIVKVYGTPYHTGQKEDFEDMIIDRLPGCDIKIGGHEFPIINGIQFDLKHKIGSSSVPYGRTTAINKVKLWNILWNVKNGQPDSQIILRGHVHYHTVACNSSDWIGMVCPALQGWGSKYGVRQCDGIVDIGVLWFKIWPDSEVNYIEWQFEKFDLPCFRVETYEV